jgi:hypothetical protein
LWFDRQLVAPIAFPKYRQIHVVLVVNMHQEVMSLATAALDAAAEQDGRDNSKNSDDNTSTFLLSDHPISSMTQRAVTDFRRTCRNHRIQYAQQLLDYDIVCLIVPSTEIRILTTFGMIDVWLSTDIAIEQFMTSNKYNTPNNFSNEMHHQQVITFPTMLITDQRFGGTRRYYKDLVSDYYNKTDSHINSISDYLTSFWRHELQHEIKSSSQPQQQNEINHDGIRTLTAATVESILFDTEESFHALIFFTASTCGHCKRFWIIWNRLGRLLQNIGWNSFIYLYQFDVSENDISATLLNVSVESIPNVYYLSPDRKTRIRYNVTDELGDGIGAVREASEILDWLVNDVGDSFMSQEQIEKLLINLEELSTNATKG